MCLCILFPALVFSLFLCSFHCQFDGAQVKISKAQLPFHIDKCVPLSLPPKIINGSFPLSLSAEEEGVNCAA